MACTVQVGLAEKERGEEGRVGGETCLAISGVCMVVWWGEYGVGVA